MKLDKKDRMILSILAVNPYVSQDKIAKLVGLSQPSVASRIKNLRKGDVLNTNVGLDPMRLGLNVCIVNIMTTEPNRILKMFAGCPFFINGYTMSGRSNLCLMFMGENISTMESIINNHLRSKEYVQDIEFNIIISCEKPLIVPTMLVAVEDKELICNQYNECPDCSEDEKCKECENFKNHQCAGCPVGEDYQGWLFVP
jgi:DNA-binding Lrp family transcriptional regulator